MADLYASISMGASHPSLIFALVCIQVRENRPTAPRIHPERSPRFAVECRVIVQIIRIVFGYTRRLLQTKEAKLLERKFKNCLTVQTLSLKCSNSEIDANANVNGKTGRPSGFTRSLLIEREFCQQLDQSVRAQVSLGSSNGCNLSL